MNQFNRLIEIFRTALNLFQSGQRKESIEKFQIVLNAPNTDPNLLMVSACLIAETHRGNGEFQLAEQYYKRSIHESDKVPAPQRIGNEWYEHYRPRANLGLITILRRTLSQEHDDIKALLIDTKGKYESFPNADLFAQLHVVQGAYYRQLGEIEGSIANINDGIAKTIQIAPPYLFWHPDHFKAILLATYLSSNAYALQASKLASDIINSSSQSWSKAFAYIGKVHLFYAGLLPMDAAERSPEIELNQEEVDSCFESLNTNSQFEKDPLLTTETILLEMIWNALLNRENRVREEFEQLTTYLTEHGSDTLTLLRAAELAAIKEIPKENNLISDKALNEILNKGSVLFNKYKKNLINYNMSSTQVDQLEEMFSAQNASKYNLKNWLCPAVRELRIRLWP